MSSIFGLKSPPPTLEADTCWDQARELVRRGPPFLPAEARALSAAFPYGLERPVQDGLDVLTMVTCAKFPREGLAEADQGPTPLDATIAAAEAELDELRARELQARTEYQRRLELARACVVRPMEWEARMADAQAALEEHRIVDQKWLQVRSRLVALGLSRDRWRLDQGS